METINNQSASTELSVYEPPEIDTELVLDFVGSDNLDEVEAGIRKLEKGTDLLDLLKGIEIVRIERDGLWRQGGFPNLRAYRIQQSERLGMPSATISARRRCAEAWIDYRKDLRSIPLEGKVSKLRYFGQALKRSGDKKETLRHFRDDSTHAFAEWSRTRKMPGTLPEVTATIKAGVLLIDGVPVARFSEGLPKEEREFIMLLARKAYSVRKGGLVPYIIPVYNAGEGVAVDRLLKKYRSGK